ncbi:MAG: hypothetical protein KatS3mg101_0764 [Patescibacteria group bacterium]|nr:MAG: hypothetical protein KatS3mg101_0764 [Patescibacteria group bacterium]
MGVWYYFPTDAEKEREMGNFLCGRINDIFRDRKFATRLNKDNIKRIVVEPYPEVDGGRVQFRRVVEYSFSDGSIKAMPPKLKEEIYKALQGRDALVEVIFQCGATLYVKVR